MYERSELDCLIYNAPLEHADLILNDDPKTYLRTLQSTSCLTNNVPPVPTTTYCRDGRDFCVFFYRNEQGIGFALPVINTSEDGKYFVMEYRGNSTGKECAKVLSSWAGKTAHFITSSYISGSSWNTAPAITALKVKAVCFMHLSLQSYRGYAITFSRIKCIDPYRKSEGSDCPLGQRQ